MDRKKAAYLIFVLPLFGPLSFVFLTRNKVFAGWRVDERGRVVYEEVMYEEGDVLGRPKNLSLQAGDQSGEIPGQAKKEEDTGSQEAEPEEGATPTPEKLTGQDRAAERRTIRTNEFVGQGSKLRITHEKNNQLRLNLQDFEGGEMEVTEATSSAELEIEDSVDKNKTKVRSDGRAFSVIRNNIEAKTNFPLMVNLDTNELMVNTPKGTKIVTVLPDQAVSNMLAANVLDQAGGKGGFQWLAYQQEMEELTRESTPSAESTESAELEEPEEATPAIMVSSEEEAEKSIEEEGIELTTTEDGTLAYEIPGIKFKKLLGLFDIRLKRKAIVSAETGELLRLEQDLRDRIFSLLSF